MTASGLENTIREAIRGVRDTSGWRLSEDELRLLDVAVLRRVREYLASDEAVEAVSGLLTTAFREPPYPDFRALARQIALKLGGDEPFCEIDAGELGAAKRDPVVREFAERADEAVRQMRDDEA